MAVEDGPVEVVIVAQVRERHALREQEFDAGHVPVVAAPFDEVHAVRQFGRGRPARGHEIEDEVGLAVGDGVEGVRIHSGFRETGPLG